MWLNSDPKKWGPISGADSLGNFAGAYTAKVQGAVASDMKIFAIKTKVNATTETTTARNRKR